MASENAAVSRDQSDYSDSPTTRLGWVAFLDRGSRPSASFNDIVKRSVARFYGRLLCVDHAAISAAGSVGASIHSNIADASCARESQRSWRVISRTKSVSCFEKWSHVIALLRGSVAAAGKGVVSSRIDTRSTPHSMAAAITRPDCPDEESMRYLTAEIERADAMLYGRVTLRDDGIGDGRPAMPAQASNGLQ